MEISVVVPTFNRADVLRRSLESVLAQTLVPAEIVVVDDASTDGTDGVISEIGSELVRYVRLPARSGSQAARNHGIREARGNWIAFQDSDDEWLPDKLERQVGLIEDEWTVVHGSGVAGEKVMGRALLGEEDALAILLRRPATLFPSLLVSRAALERMGPLDEELVSFQEWDTSIRLARFCRFVAPSDPVFVYHQTPGAISESAATYLHGYEAVIEKHRAEIPAAAWEEHVRVLARRALELRRWDDARRLVGLARRRDARLRAYALCASLRLRPRSLPLTRS